MPHKPRRKRRLQSEMGRREVLITRGTLGNSSSDKSAMWSECHTYLAKRCLMELVDGWWTSKTPTLKVARSSHRNSTLRSSVFDVSHLESLIIPQAKLGAFIDTHCSSTSINGKFDIDNSTFGQYIIKCTVGGDIPVEIIPYMGINARILYHPSAREQLKLELCGDHRFNAFQEGRSMSWIELRGPATLRTALRVLHAAGAHPQLTAGVDGHQMPVVSEGAAFWEGLRHDSKPTPVSADTAGVDSPPPTEYSVPSHHMEGMIPPWSVTRMVVLDPRTVKLNHNIPTNIRARPLAAPSDVRTGKRAHTESELGSSFTSCVKKAIEATKPRPAGGVSLLSMMGINSGDVDTSVPTQHTVNGQYRGPLHQWSPQCGALPASTPTTLELSEAAERPGPLQQRERLAGGLATIPPLSPASLHCPSVTILVRSSTRMTIGIPLGYGRGLLARLVGAGAALGGMTERLSAGFEAGELSFPHHFPETTPGADYSLGVFTSAVDKWLSLPWTKRPSLGDPSPTPAGNLLADVWSIGALRPALPAGFEAQLKRIECGERASEDAKLGRVTRTLKLKKWLLTKTTTSVDELVSQRTCVSASTVKRSVTVEVVNPSVCSHLLKVYVRVPRGKPRTGDLLRAFDDSCESTLHPVVGVVVDGRYSLSDGHGRALCMISPSYQGSIRLQRGDALLPVVVCDDKIAEVVI
eukprot:gnl/Dysnectes_brevis/5605_a8154_643.p1 GENE.gnl/Dysnectes_brevis/5605_a8154_643~~gnl/Dysnectes_brevis/5605_a8154_643.p1  ORF type:complete len:816 (-),score=55.94 gnl/Dysnectes_brevis/5605_a8154_643:48-2129(-)